MTDKRTVALLFGGRSNEHSVSCATAGGILGAIDRERFEPIPIGITRDGTFVRERDDPAAFALGEGFLADVEDNGTRVSWPERAGERTLTFTGPHGGARTTVDVDVVFPVLHGPWGEDGTIQGMLDLMGLPYIGSGVLASAVGMDKHFTKTILRQGGVPVAPWVSASRREWASDPLATISAAAELGYPLFVKPARGGSSVGVSRVTSENELATAMTLALAEDDRALIEVAMNGREVEVAILGGRPGEEARSSLAGEIVITGRDFYDFEAKYQGAPGIELLCPAQLSEAELATMQGLALRAFDAIDARGLARVDFFLTEDGFVLNEINTMPGFTPISMFPKCWEASGLSYSRLITELIDCALADANGTTS